MSDQRRRRRANIQTTLGERFVFWDGTKNSLFADKISKAHLTKNVKIWGILTFTARGSTLVVRIWRL